MVSLAIFKGEKNVADLAARLFPSAAGGAPSAQATAALLKANPQLSDLAHLPDGAVLVVPDLPAQAPSSSETVSAATLAPADPVRVLGDQAAALGTGLATQAANATAQANATLTLLKDSGLTAAASKDQTLAARLTTISNTTSAALKDVQTQQTIIQQGIAQLQEDLAKFVSPTLPSTPPASPTPPVTPPSPVTPPRPSTPPVSNLPTRPPVASERPSLARAPRTPKGKKKK
jgi:hypothetical protein